MKDGLIALENEELLVEVSPFGSELKRVFLKSVSQDVLYDGKGSWDHSDHILFPIIGNNRSFALEGRQYLMPNTHGYARVSAFDVDSQSEDSLTLSLLHQGDETYPFDCKISVTTKLEKNRVVRETKVISNSGQEMAFQYGLHPGFINDFSDSSLELGEGTILLELENGIIQRRIAWPHPLDWEIERPFIEKRDTLVLTNPKGRITLHNGQGRRITLLSPCPYFAVWTPQKRCKNDFICLESWYGLSPYVGMPNELGDRDHVQKTKDIAAYRDVLIIE